MRIALFYRIRRADRILFHFDSPAARRVTLGLLLSGREALLSANITE